MMQTLTDWQPERIPISHQLPSMPHEGCCQIPQECESGWEPLPRAGELATEEKPKIDKSECLIKKKGILAYFKGNDKTGYICYPPWMKLFEPYTPPKCPAPPIDKKVETTIERLTKNIQKTYVHSANNNHRQCDNFIGSRTKDYEYECVATDTHRALLVRQKKVKKTVNGVCVWSLWNVNEVPNLDAPSLTLEDPGIFLAIKRLSTILEDDKYFFIALTWSHKSGQLIISAENSFKEEGIESFACKATYSGRIALDPRYVLPALGTWPLVMYQEGKDRPAVFMPDTKKREFMYVLMPMKL